MWSGHPGYCKSVVRSSWLLQGCGQVILAIARVWSGHPGYCKGVVRSPWLLQGCGQVILAIARVWSGHPGYCKGVVRSSWLLQGCGQVILAIARVWSGHPGYCKGVVRSSWLLQGIRVEVLNQWPQHLGNRECKTGHCPYKVTHSTTLWGNIAGTCTMLATILVLYRVCEHW